jgi:hypothetical protein
MKYVWAIDLVNPDKKSTTVDVFLRKTDAQYVIKTMKIRRRAFSDKKFADLITLKKYYCSTGFE